MIGNAVKVMRMRKPESRDSLARQRVLEFARHNLDAGVESACARIHRQPSPRRLGVIGRRRLARHSRPHRVGQHGAREKPFAVWATVSEGPALAASAADSVDYHKLPIASGLY